MKRRIWKCRSMTERGMACIQRAGLGMYVADPLTTANIGKVFVT